MRDKRGLQGILADGYIVPPMERVTFSGGLMSTDAHAAADHGHMDVHEQKDTFGHFVTFALWCTLHIVMAVALLTVAFAVGAGWLAGVAAFFVIGAGAGAALRLNGAWWAAIIVQTILLAIGGVIVSLVV